MEQSPHELARIIALRQSSGSDARNLLAPPPLEPIKPPIRKIKPAKEVNNHQTKYKGLLKDLQNKNRTLSKEQEEKVRNEKEKMIRMRLKSVGQVGSKLFPLRNLCLSSTDPTTCNSNSQRTHSITGTTPTLEGTSTSSAGSTLSFTPQSTIFEMMKSQGIKKNKDTSTINDDKSATIIKHCNFGRVPRYILERRIELAEEDQGKRIRGEEEILADQENERCNMHSMGHSFALPNIHRMSDLRMPEKQKLLRELSENEAKIKKELEKLPFGLQSEGSIRKRDRLYDSMKDIENTKKIVLSTPTWGRRRR